MTIKIHNKEYTTVAERIDQFRNDKGEWPLISEVVSMGDVVVIKASIYDDAGKLVSVGHAEEVRGSSAINKTSALENCETSAWGRALAALGYGGDQVASANEVSDAVIKQAQIEAVERIVRHNAAVREHFTSISAIKDALAADNFDLAAEAFSEIPDDDRKALALATTKGGIYTLAEVAKFKDERWAEARKRYIESQNEYKL